MSIKHVKEFYKQMTSDYNEMCDNLRDLEQECLNKLVEPEVIENYKKRIQPVKDNWEKWNYLIFLLNMPNKKSKKDKYIKLNKLPKTDLLKQNKETLDELKGGLI